MAVANQHLLDELATVLARPKFRRWIALADAVASVEALGREADLPPEPGAVPQRVRDPDDDDLVALGDAAEAVIVTGDADLLEADLATSDHSSRATRSTGLDISGHTPSGTT